MKRIKRKGRDIGRKKTVKRATEETLGFYIPLCYVALMDEFNFDVETCRAWKVRLDRYAGYIADGVLSFRDVERQLKAAGFDREEED